MSAIFDFTIETINKILDALKLIRDKSDIPKIKVIEMIIAQMRNFTVMKRKMVHDLLAVSAASDAGSILDKFQAENDKLDKLDANLGAVFAKVSDDEIEPKEMEYIASYFTHHVVYDTALSEYFDKLEHELLADKQTALAAEMAKFERSMKAMAFATRAFGAAVSIGDKLKKLPEFLEIFADLIAKNKDVILMIAATIEKAAAGSNPKTEQKTESL